MPKEKKEKAKKILVVEEVSPEETNSEDVIQEEKKEEVGTEILEKDEEANFSEEKKEETLKPESEKTVIQEKKEEKASVNKSSYLWITIPIALLFGALAGGLITYFSGVSKLESNDVTSTPISTSIPTDETSPTDSPTKDLERDTLKIQVLNGSGVAGAAGKAKVYLEGLGYVDIVSGNASTSDFPETEISIKDSSKDYLELITSDLEKNYEVAKETKTLVSSSAYDVVITIGQK